MYRKIIVGVCALLCLVARSATGETWTSTDVGSVGIAGSGRGGGTWTVAGSGGDIWGTADAFQFVHVPVGAGGSVSACVRDLQNTNPFAKAGVMVRARLNPNAATAILDVKPDGGVEFMIRQHDGGAMQYIEGRAASFPVCVSLAWDEVQFQGTVSSTAGTWTTSSVIIELPATSEGGLAVTSHDDSQLAVAHFDSAVVDKAAPDIGDAVDVGDVGVAGDGGGFDGAGMWTVTGAGGDIWGAADAFHYFYRLAKSHEYHVVVRVDDLAAANQFAKAGIMVRNGLDAGAAAIVLDVRPGGQIEFMSRRQQNDSMMFLGTANVAFPVWLQLDWHITSGSGPDQTVVASFSRDHEHWQTVGEPLTWTVHDYFLAGIAVTSHDVTRTATAHFSGFSLLPHDVWGDDIGPTGLVGNASVDFFDTEGVTTVQAAGSDIWGASDSFYFVHRGAVATTQGGSIDLRVFVFEASHPFAKAGVMYRDGLAPDAPSVILDVKPDGAVEFMARKCAGCETEFIAGGHVPMGTLLTLSRDSSGTFTAIAACDVGSAPTTIGSVSVAMTTPTAGLATTSHDPTLSARVMYQYPPD